MTAVACPSPLIAPLFPKAMATAELRGFRGRVDVAIGDEIQVARASPKRRDEFAAGRLCGVMALRSLGTNISSIGRESGGAPIWPSGFVGSISHTDDVAVAAVGRSEEFGAVGLDIERRGAIEPALWTSLFSMTERLRIESASSAARDDIATALFSAKEAFYKAQWPITREWVDFLDIEVDLRDGIIAIFPRAPRAWTRAFLGRPEGSVTVQGDLVAAAVIMATP